MKRMTLALVFTAMLGATMSACDLSSSNHDGPTLDQVLHQMMAENDMGVMDEPVMDPNLVALGQALFFDKELSGNRNISCATCHLSEFAISDGISLSVGAGGEGAGPDRQAPLDDFGQPVFHQRNSIAPFDRSESIVQFWDGRVRNLGEGEFETPAGDMMLPGLSSSVAAVAMFPVTDRNEMRGKVGENELADIADEDFQGMWEALMMRILAIEEYRDLFGDAYPDVDEVDLTFVHAANAIAAFIFDHWSLGDSPFDRYLEGEDDALSNEAKRGGILFFGKAKCAECHNGPEMTDNDFHNRVVPQIGPGKGDGPEGLHDFGRERVTGLESDRWKFRTQPLRNTAATGPWMHSGAFTSLEAVVRHELDPAGSALTYNPSQLTNDMANVYRADQTAEILEAADPDDIAPIHLTQAEVDDIVAFLLSMNSPQLPNLPAQDIPESVPSGLPVED